MAICTDSDSYKVKDGQFEGLFNGNISNATWHEFSDKKISCSYNYYGDELNPNGMKTPGPDPFDKIGEELSKQP